MPVRRKASLLKRVKPTKRYLITKQRALKKQWRGVPKEEKSELRRLVVVLAITFATVAGLYFLGINLLTNIGGFWATLRGQGSELSQKDSVAPPPPYLSSLPLYTNKDAATVEGYAESGSEVSLSVNGVETGKAIAEKNGQFTFSDVALGEGENKITAFATDGAGNRSLESAALKCILDKTPPELAVNQPAAGQQFSGESNKVTVAGTTESGATVKINDSQASVLAEGSFTFTAVLSQEGETTFTVVATDRAGNEAKAEITVTYSKQ